MSVWATDEGPVLSTKMNQKTLLIDTGINIGAATTYPGMIVICTSTGSGASGSFAQGAVYQRDPTNTYWVTLYSLDDSSGRILFIGNPVLSALQTLLDTSNATISGTGGALVSLAHGSGGATHTYTLPNAFQGLFFFILNNTGESQHIAPPGTEDLTLSGSQYTNGSPLSLAALHNLIVWSDGASWWGVTS